MVGIMFKNTTLKYIYQLIVQSKLHDQFCIFQLFEFLKATHSYEKANDQNQFDDNQKETYFVDLENLKVISQFLENQFLLIVTYTVLLIIHCTLLTKSSYASQYTTQSILSCPPTNGHVQLELVHFSMKLWQVKLDVSELIEQQNWLLLPEQARQVQPHTASLSVSLSRCHDCGM